MIARLVAAVVCLIAFLPEPSHQQVFLLTPQDVPIGSTPYFTAHVFPNISVTQATWSKDGQTILQTPKYFMQSANNQFTLVVLDSSAADQGQYKLTILGTVNGQSVFGEISAFYGDSPQVAFRLTLSDQRVNEGSPATLQVRLTQTVSDARWYRNNVPLANTPNKYNIVSQDTLYYLEISNAAPSDEGTYRFEGGGLASTMFLTVVAAAGPTIREGLTSILVAEGEVAAFTLRLSQADVNSGIWYRNNVPLTFDSRVTRSTVGDTQTLTINPAQRGDQGTYSYRALGLTTQATLQVVYITSPHQSQNVQVGQPVTFTVQLSVASANPGVWTRNGVQLSSGQNIGIITDGAARRLNIRAAQQGDQGTYVYTYSAGVTASASLIVGTTVSVQEGLTPQTITEGQGTLFQLRLSQSGVATGRWLKDGSAFAVDGNRVQVSTSGPFQRLRFTSVRRGDTGTYSYTAGSATTQALLRVVYITTPAVTQSVTAGQSVVFTVVLSVPTTTAGFWSRNTIRLFNTANIQIQQDGSRRTLRIVQTQQSDAGQYTYQYDTGVSSSAGLNVNQAAALIARGLTSQTVSEGRPATMEVQLSQSDVPVGTWTRNGVAILLSARVQASANGFTHSLTISSVSRADEGNYRYTVNGQSTTGDLRVVYVLNGAGSSTTQAGQSAVFVVTLSQPGVTTGTWSRNGIQLFNSGNIQISTSGAIQRLTVFPVTASDAGTYRYEYNGVTSFATLTVPGPAVVDGQFGQWSLWTDPACDNSCGTGPNKVALRTRQCDSPRPSFGGRDCQGLATQTRSKFCSLAACPVPTNHLCQNTERLSDVGYRYHPTDCTKYIQCFYSPTGSVFGAYRSCGLERYWDQTTLSCVQPAQVNCPLERCSGKCRPHYKYQGSCRSYQKCVKGKALGSCCLEGFSYKEDQGCVPDFFCQDQCPPPCSNFGVCLKKPTYNGNAATYTFVQGGNERTGTCRGGNYFDITDCACSTDNTACSPLYDLRLNNAVDLNRFVWLTTANLRTDSGFVDFISNSSFNADLRLTAASQASDVMVKFIYREANNIIGRRVLLSTGNCLKANSLVVAVDSGNLVFEIFNRKSHSYVLPVSLNGFARSARKVVTFIYTMFDITVSLATPNGDVKFTAKLPAPDAAILECGMRVGSDGINPEYNFIGTMEQLTVYTCSNTVVL